MDNLTLQLIRDHEGYSPEAYWDVNAWRVGYGSDTVTDENGKTQKVTKSTTTTRADAERDLARRVPEFQRDGVVRYVGQKAWDALTPEAKAAVTSVAYNYGSIAKLRTLKRAIVSGEPKKVAEAIRARSTDNGGVNAKRRAHEADLILSAKAAQPNARQNIAAQRAEQAEMRNRVFPTVPARRPETVAGKVVKPLPAPAPLSFGKVGSVLTGSTAAAKAAPKAPVAGLKLPVAPAAKAAPSAPAKPAVTASGRTVAQIGQDADNARLSGYRAIQEMGPSSKGAPAKPAAPGKGVIKTTAPEQQPIPHDVVPSSVKAMGYGKSPLLATGGGTALTGPMGKAEADLTVGASAKAARLAAGAAAGQRAAAAQAAADRAQAAQAAAAANAKALAQKAAMQRAADARAQAAKALAARTAAMQFYSNGVANPAYRNYSNGQSEGGGVMPANAFGGNGGGGFTDSLGGTYYDRHL